MAHGRNYTLMQTATPANRLKPGEYDGRVKVMVDDITFAGETTAVNLCGTIPKGSIVLAVYISMAALGAAIDIGDAEDPDRYFSAQVSGAVIMQQGDEIDGINYEVDESDADNLDSQIQLLPAAAVTGAFKITVLYAHD